MSKWTLRCVTAICGLLIAGVSLYAHHSLAGVYALGKEAKVTGAFKAFRIVNPHSSLRIDVKDKDGKIVEWGSSVAASPVSRGSALEEPQTDRMLSTPAINSPSPSFRRWTARVRLDF
jgi:hypothetical protein